MSNTAVADKGFESQHTFNFHDMKVHVIIFGL